MAHQAEGCVELHCYYGRNTVFKWGESEHLLLSPATGKHQSSSLGYVERTGTVVNQVLCWGQEECMDGDQASGMTHTVSHC